MKTWGTVLLIILFLCAACATAPQVRQIQNAFPINAPFDQTWTALIETFADLNIPIDNMEKDSGLVTVNAFDITGQKNDGYCDCGGLGVNIEVRRTGKFNVFLKSTSDSTCELKVNCIFDQAISFGDAVSTRRCISTGNLEREIYELIMAKL